jgi:hypothetical protein
LATVTVLFINAPLQEIIPADSLYFDIEIEIKATDLAIAGHGSRWTNVVKEHSKLLKDMWRAHEEHIFTVSDLYRDVGSADFAGVECAAGYTLLSTHVETFCLDMLRVPDID